MSIRSLRFTPLTSPDARRWAAVYKQQRLSAFVYKPLMTNLRRINL